MDLRVKAAISEKNELKKRRRWCRGLLTWLCSLFHTSSFSRRMKKKITASDCSSPAGIGCYDGERESPVKEDCVFVSGWMLMTGLCNESLKS